MSDCEYCALLKNNIDDLIKGEKDIFPNGRSEYWQGWRDAIATCKLSLEKAVDGSRHFDVITEQFWKSANKLKKENL